MPPQAILLVVVVTLLTVTIVFAAGRTIRQILRRQEQRRPGTTLNVDYTVGDLQEMLRAGQLTPAEFERARLVVLRNASAREAQADRERGHAFEVIQYSAALPPVAPLAPLPSPSPSPPPLAGDGDGGDASRDAR